MALKPGSAATLLRTACRRIAIWLGVIGWGVCCAGELRAQAAAQLPPRYWQDRLFFIPYQPQQQGLFDRVATVELLLSRTGTADWTPLERAKPNLQGFSYHAPEDGEFWFALRHLDRQGNPWPSAAVAPQLRIVVDTVKPELSVSGEQDVAGLVVVRYEARDQNLRPESIAVELREDGGAWTRLPLPPADLAQPDRLVGRAEWRGAASAQTIELRASVSDQAEHTTTASGEVALSGPELRQAGNPFVAARNQSAEGERSILAPSVQNWPPSNRLPQTSIQPRQPSSAPSLELSGPPPITNPYFSVSTGAGEFASESSKGRLAVTPLDEHNRPAPRTPSADAWVPAQAAPSAALREVNARTFDLEYEVETVGPWGVAKVELWGTTDGGRTWDSFGVDPDSRSPIRVSVPNSGSYGFRILVDGANGARSLPPSSGDQPELLISVDLKPPTVESLTANLGQGEQANFLSLRWSATDTNLETRPVSLYYSSFPGGPWSMIATGIENTGIYAWRIERHVPERFYVRMEVRDTAGNVSSYQLPQPITLSRPKPSGHLSGVRPITDDAVPRVGF